MWVAQFVKAESFKKFIEEFEELLSVATLIWTQNGLELLVLDAHDVSAVHLKLSASSFERYQCCSNRTFGLRMAALIRIMRRVDPEDGLTLCVSGAANCCTVRYQSRLKQSEYELYLVRPRDLTIPEPAVACAVKMSAEKFCKILTTLAKVSKTITIACNDANEVEFSARGKVGNVCREWLKDSSGGAIIKTETAVTNKFASEYLKLLAKTGSFGPNVQILLRQDFPIAVEYDLGQGSTLKCYLPPLSD